MSALTKPVTSVYYSFDSKNLPAGLVAAYKERAERTLREHFKLSPEKVRVIPKSWGKESALQLTCYVSRAETCPVAMVEAAKRVLPQLRALEKRVAQAQAAVEAWTPGSDVTHDRGVLEQIADGLVLRLSAAQSTFIQSAAPAGLTLERQASALRWLLSHRPRTALRLSA